MKQRNICCCSLLYLTIFILIISFSQKEVEGGPSALVDYAASIWCWIGVNYGGTTNTYLYASCSSLQPELGYWARLNPPLIYEPFVFDGEKYSYRFYVDYPVVGHLEFQMSSDFETLHMGGMLQDITGSFQSNRMAVDATVSLNCDCYTNFG